MRLTKFVGLFLCYVLFERIIVVYYHFGLIISETVGDFTYFPTVLCFTEVDAVGENEQNLEKRPKFPTVWLIATGDTVGK